MLLVVHGEKLTVAENLNWWALYFGEHFISPSFFAHLCPTLFYSYRKLNLIFLGQEGGEFKKKTLMASLQYGRNIRVKFQLSTMSGT